MKRILSCVFLLFVLFITHFAGAGDYSFVTLEYPPIEYTGKDGKAEGIAVDMVTRIMEKLGHTVHIKGYPWTRALAMVQEGRADAIFTAYQTPEREKLLDYCTEDLLPQVLYFYVKKGSEITFEGDLAALKGKKIGVVSTISYGNRFDQSKDVLHLQIEKANQLEQNFQKLLLGRIDLVVSNVYTGDYTIRKMGLEGEIVKVPQQIESVPSYVAFSKKRNLKELRDRFDRQLIELKDTGEYSKILNKYGLDIKEPNP